jgi:hypothetical protein
MRTASSAPLDRAGYDIGPFIVQKAHCDGGKCTVVLDGLHHHGASVRSKDAESAFLLSDA